MLRVQTFLKIRWFSFLELDEERRREQFMDSCGLSLQSNPEVQTYFYKGGRSTPDPLFVSRQVAVTWCGIGSIRASDHEPIMATYRTRQRLHDPFPFTKTTLGWVNVQKLEAAIVRISKKISPSKWVWQCMSAVHNSRKLTWPRKNQKSHGSVASSPILPTKWGATWGLFEQPDRFRRIAVLIVADGI